MCSQSFSLNILAAFRIRFAYGLLNSTQIWVHHMIGKYSACIKLDPSMDAWMKLDRFVIKITSMNNGNFLGVVSVFYLNHCT